MSIPPATYGGTERVVHWLTEALCRRGHEVTLFAAAGSCTSAALHEVVPGGLIEAMARGHAYEYEHYSNHALAEAVRRSAEFDVIHCHLECRTIPVGVGARARVLHTLHTPLSPDDCWILERYPNVAVSTVSHYQASVIPAARRASVDVVHHGMDFGAYRASHEPGRYLAFLGRMGRQKSPAAAIRVAREVGMPIVLAGEPEDAVERAYFTEHVQPHVDGDRVRHVGRVDDRQKEALLRGAAALLFPIQDEESFGLAMIEAMACGTPVVASARASVREIIDVGITGFHAESVDELAPLVAAAVRLDRAVVRRRAEERFGVEAMVNGYLSVYGALARAGQS